MPNSSPPPGSQENFIDSHPCAMKRAHPDTGVSSNSCSQALGEMAAAASVTPDARQQTQNGLGSLPARPIAKILPESGLGLERLNVRRLPTLGPLHHIELHGLAFLQALET
jgi:hypothetical protein